MNIERIKHLVTNLLTGSSSTSERTELAKWINSEDAERASREAWKNASEKIDDSLEDEMWNEIRSKIEEATPQPAPTLTIRHRSYFENCRFNCRYSMFSFCFLSAIRSFHRTQG